MAITPSNRPRRIALLVALGVAIFVADALDSPNWVIAALLLVIIVAVWPMITRKT